MGLTWAGDLRTCFLLDEGWAFRLEVNRFHLAGRAGWRVPLAFAEEIDLPEGEHRFFEPVDSRLKEEVALSRVDRKCVGGPIDEPLAALGAKEGDLAFFTVRKSGYMVVLRRRSELDEADALGRLLWSCSLDPSDRELRSRPWPTLARVLGRAERTRDTVRGALARRGDEALVQIVDELERGSDRSLDPWPLGWEFVMPMTHDQSGFGLIGGDHGHRAAIGVADTSGQPPRGLIRSSGGLLWMHHATAIEPDDVLSIIRASPTGMHVAAHKEGWVRWLRAEHWARRSALLGSGWEITVSGQGWFVGSSEHDQLVSALEQVHLDTERVPAAPRQLAQSTYPISALGFKKAVRDAAHAGLRRLRAHELDGFAAEYANTERTGPMLLDVLA